LKRIGLHWSWLRLRHAVCIVSSVSSLAAVACLLRLDIFPVLYVAALVSVAIVGNGVIAWLLLRKAHNHRKNRIMHGLGYLLAALAIAAAGTGVYVFTRSFSTLNNIANDRTKTVNFSVVVLAGSPITRAEQVRGKPIAAVTSSEQQYMSAITAQTKPSSVVSKPSYPALLQALYGKQSEVVVLNEAYRSSLTEFYPGLSHETRVIKTITIREKNKAASSTPLNGAAFNVYISGIDTYGDISTVSRSDVNIVATINPKAKTMLLTTIPRDSYVPIALGGHDQYDKLTHAGIYGVDSSVQTIDNLLGIHISGYARVNFTSLIGLVETLGGVDVDNPVAFQVGSYNFRQGVIHLDGKQALAYSRERHSLAGGDLDRGVNQQRVIKALFEKSMSPAGIPHFQAMLNTIGVSVQSNVSRQDISKFVSTRLAAHGQWKVEMQDVKGTGETGQLPSYAMPGSALYMYVLSAPSVAANKAAIQHTMTLR
jgi:LCP family protein required for cell wall assembly